jgi:hypothetical protein
MPNISAKAAPPRPQSRLKSISVVLVIILSGAVLVGVVYGATKFSALGLFIDGCSRSADQAAKAAPQLQAKLDGLHLVAAASPAPPAVSTTYGDCIDTSSHTAEASFMYNLPNTPLLPLHQRVQAQLRARGYIEKKALSVENIQQITDNVKASADNATPDGPDLHISYIITPHDPNACADVAQSGAKIYNQCFAQYKAKYADLSQLGTTSVTALMAQDFPNN